MSDRHVSGKASGRIIFQTLAHFLPDKLETQNSGREGHKLDKQLGFKRAGCVHIEERTAGKVHVKLAAGNVIISSFMPQHPEFTQETNPNISV